MPDATVLACSDPELERRRALFPPRVLEGPPMTSTPPSAEPPPSVITVSHAVYALHAFAILVGVVGAATVVGSFVGSVPSIVAVILNYLKRRGARDTWVASHYSWQIRTFWFALLWLVIAWVLIVTIVGAL